MHRALLVVLAVVALGACGSGGGSDNQSSKASSGSTATTGRATLATSATPSIEITDFGPSGHNVSVNFQVDNKTSSDFRFEWAKFVLTAPDGSAHTAFRSSSSAPYELVAPGATLADGGIFQFDSFVAGHYKISYDRRVLAEKDL